VCEGKNRRGHRLHARRFRLSRDLLVKEARAAKLGIPAVALFPALPTGSRTTATESLNPDGLLQQTVRALKDAVPELCVITDVAHGPLLQRRPRRLRGRAGEIENDRTVEILAAMAVAQAAAGADLVAPSDMMDGRVGAMRAALDEAGHTEVGILSYAAKYCSAFYGPFRDALDSAPRAGDKKTYQMDPANAREALREVQLDVAEGADIVMVKPALPYLDIIRAVREAVPCRWRPTRSAANTR
jgi:porphobilinogen synthase